MVTEAQCRTDVECWTDAGRLSACSRSGAFLCRDVDIGPTSDHLSAARRLDLGIGTRTQPTSGRTDFQPMSAHRLADVGMFTELTKTKIYGGRAQLMNACGPMCDYLL